MDYEKYWFVLPVHEVAMRRNLVLDDAANSKEGSTKAKVLAMVILGLSALFCSTLPIGVAAYLTRGRGLGRKATRLLAVLLRFGGGILLATTFVHLLPEVREGYENLQKVTPKLKSWPENLPELIMCAGFFMMYGVEELAHKCLHAGHGRSGPGSSRTDQDSEEAAGGKASRPSHRRPSHQNDNGHSHVVSGGPPVRGLLIIIALSVHQVFEGLAVGLEEDASHVWVLLGAVAAHKLVIAFCVGFEIASATVGFVAATACVAVFAVASPIGIGIGLGLSSGAEPSESIDIASVVLQGLATGTLLFVVFFEVLTKTEDEHSGSSSTGIIHYASAVVGFIFMTILLYEFTD